MARNATLSVGMFGTDNNHDFEVVETRDSEAKIRYISDGKEAWFMDNRFQMTGSGLELV